MPPTFALRSCLSCRALQHPFAFRGLLRIGCYFKPVRANPGLSSLLILQKGPARKPWKEPLLRPPQATAKLANPEAGKGASGRSQDTETVSKDDASVGDYIQVGRIVDTFGVKGELRVRSETDFPEERFQQAGKRWLRWGNKSADDTSALEVEEVELKSGRPGPSEKGLVTFLIRLAGVDSIEAAEEYVGATLLVRRGDLPKLDEGEFYTPELAGMHVVLQSTKEAVGTIVDVVSAGPNDLLKVQRAGHGGGFLWIPFVKEIVPVVDPVSRSVEITPPEGLLELNAPKGPSVAKLRRQEIGRKVRLRREMSTIKQRFTKAGQSHVLAGLSEGAEDQKDALLTDLMDLDLRILLPALEQALSENKSSNGQPAPPSAVQKADWTRVSEWKAGSESQDSTARWWWKGLAMIAQGRVAAMVLAGGQGTRLGPHAPPAKGMLDIGLPSRKSLFQLQAERLIRIQEIAAQLRPQVGDKKPCIPWLVMTSNATDEVTRQFFEENAFFGLVPDQVRFVKQGNMACVSLEEGNPILMETPWAVARAPDGNGGVFQALHRAGALEWLAEQGVELVQAYAVDNALVRVADPVFFGFCEERGAEVGIKVVGKAHAEEAVGVVCLQEGAEKSGTQYYGVLEYSELEPDLRYAKEKGSEELLFRAAHICINMFSLDFLSKLGGNPDYSLPFHLAKKKIPHVKRDEESGEWQQVNPEKPNGIKLEQFIFDAFKFCPEDRVAVLEVNREEEFAPIKNASGPGVPDSPATACQLVSALHKQWLEVAKKAHTDDSKPDVGISQSLEKDGLVELPASATYAGEGLH